VVNEVVSIEMTRPGKSYILLNTRPTLRNIAV